MVAEWTVFYSTVILKASLQTLRLNMSMHNFLQKRYKHQFRELRILYGLAKNINCMVFTNFQHAIELHSFQNLSLGFNFKIFLGYS